MTTLPPPHTKEQQRLQAPFSGPLHPWRKWGPNVSERSWGTVREDYSPHGEAWSYLSHDLARSKAYRWGEDGLAGICDRYQMLVLALALWNGHDPIHKERLFGLIPAESNHGEDVKEYYFYLDATPTHAYMKYLYKYPQAAYPYAQLIEQSRQRRATETEYELMDTGLFDTQRYFDVFVEYAKASPEDICMRLEVCNRGPEEAPIHLLPHLWFAIPGRGPDTAAAATHRPGAVRPGLYQLAGRTPPLSCSPPCPLSTASVHATSTARLAPGRCLRTTRPTRRASGAPGHRAAADG